MTLENNYGIVPPSGEFGKNWPVHHNIPAGASGSLSTGGWTIDNILQKNVGNEGFIQQTFLGGSVRSFDLNAGFGDTTSTLNVQIVNDEFNSSDGTPIGMGDDPYHSGVQDTFLPPIVGSPVYFKFGKNFANIEQAFRQTFDNLYKVQTLPTKTNRNNAWGWDFPETPYDPENFNQLERYNFVDLTRNVIEDRSILWNSNTSWRGRNHFVFGGILQSYTQNKSLEGSLFSVTVVDPREILASVEVLLNNYQGTVFNNKNIINLYGFLEYDPSTVLLQDFRNSQIMAGIVEKFVDGFGNLDYFGISANWNSVDGWETDPNKSLANVLTNDFTWTKTGLSEVFIPGRVVNLQDQYYFGLNAFNGSVKPEFFPITGQGFSRRSDKGMPWYRISHGLAAIFQYYGFLPQEYVNAGFGGQINFRGYNYVVDFGGIPTERIPLLYYMDFDKIDLLSLAQELCDIISHDLYVTLLPVIDHPACDFLWKYNQEQVKAKRPENIVAGIIRLDAIDRTTQPRYGAIKSYLDELEDRGIHVENQDVGFELSNVVTDKFVVGAQEVDMYLFSTERDRDTLWKLEENADNLNILQMQQWDLRTQLQQQLIPYYGLLGNKAVSIPRGFGSFQQILLDARELDAFGVGNYYVATELELRAALVSFDTWKNFLLSYNDVYIEDISEHSAFFDALSTENDQINRVLDQFKANVNFDSLEEGIPKQRIEEYLDLLKNRQFAVTVPRCVWDSDRPYMTEDGYPASPCSPPFGYPLYYKRATRIGIVEAGVISVLNTKTRVVSDIEDLKKQFENKNSPLLNLGKDRLDKYNNEISKQLQNLAKGKKDDSYKNTPIYRSLIEKKEEAVSILNNFDELKSNALATKGLISLVENLDKPENGSLATTLFNIEKTARKHTENAKKVYEFIRKIADECLGKKFLVRIPKACNLNYNVSVNTFTGTQPYNVATGPFGFVPRPINADPNYASSPLFQLEIDQIKFSRLISEESLFHHYLEDYTNSAFPDNGFKLGISSNYTNGALKGNYNPFSESWEWNYKPEPQGGFYSHSLFGTNLTSLEYLNGRIPFSSLPLVMQQGLLPIDVQNLLSDSNRMQCYVKYNHSHTLDFTGVNPEDMTQQTIEFGGQFVPDIVESLPNNNIDAETSFDSINELTKDQRLLERKKDSVAFVKCEIEERLYLPPKLQKKNLDVWANEYEMKFSFPEMKLVREIKEDCTGGFRNEFPRALPVFSVPRNGGKDGSSASWTDFERRWDENLNGWIVNTDIPQLDDEHVYALITVPGRIKSTIDVRWKDGPMQAYNTWRIKHLMTQDVVKIPEFSKPSLPSADLTRTMLPCGPAPVYETQEQAEQEAKNYGLIGSHQRPTPKDVEREKNGGGKQPVGYSPGLEDDWIKISLEEISSARRITKKVLKGFALGQPQIELGFTSPSPVFPDLIAIPLMSQERCYGPWLSASQLDSSADARIKYSNIGGRVEFIKDENLAPWNYAGYQLMDQAGSLQAQFSNSLLLFSERGGFVIPDAPTGIALATALKDGGPLITSIGIQVDPTNGVKTTVKMDLYTSRFGKLQKQKEMAISQIARERQRLLDEKNNAIRRGLGKRQTSADLVNTVMQAGGKRISDIASEITRQINTNEKLGREIQDTIISVGDNNGAVMTKEDATRLFGLMDRNTLARQFGQNVIAPMASILQAYSNLPNSVLPSVEPYVGRWFNDRLDNKNQE
jgi:hypothetical protein